MNVLIDILIILAAVIIGLALDRWQPKEN